MNHISINQSKESQPFLPKITCPSAHVMGYIMQYSTDRIKELQESVGDATAMSSTLRLELATDRIETAMGKSEMNFPAQKAISGVQEAAVSNNALLESMNSEQSRTMTSAKAELEQVLSRMHDVTNTLLHEMSGILQSLTEVETDFDRVLKSQEDEKNRLESVAPEIFGTTSRLI